MLLIADNDMENHVNVAQFEQLCTLQQVLPFGPPPFLFCIYDCHAQDSATHFNVKSCHKGLFLLDSRYVGVAVAALTITI